MEYVIIGNGGAGISALQTIRDRDKGSTITIVSREEYPAYSPCSLPNLLSGEMEKQKIYRFDKNFYKDLDARFVRNAEAIQISPKNKTVRLANGNDIEFDKLLIATHRRQPHHTQGHGRSGPEGRTHHGQPGFDPGDHLSRRTGC